MRRNRIKANQRKNSLIILCGHIIRVFNMKNNIMRMISMLFIISLTTSCSNDFLIDHKINGKSVDLSFYRTNLLFFYRKFRPCLRWLIVYDESAPNRQRIWHLKAPHGQCSVLERVTVGRIPKGFVEDYQFTPMKVGHKYSVAAEDIKGMYGTSESWELR